MSPGSVMRSRVMPWMVSPGAADTGSGANARRDRPVVDVVGHRHRLAPGVHDADLVAEMQVDRRRPHLVREERIDHHSPRLDLPPESRRA
jgi:hypothetical protein